MIAIIILALIVIRISFINADDLSDFMSNFAKFLFFGTLCGFALFILVDGVVRTNERNIDGQTVSSYSIIDASERFMYIANNDDTIKLSWEYVVSALDNNHNGKDASAMRLIACDTNTKPHATLTKYHHTPNKISLMFFRDREDNYITKKYDLYIPCGDRKTLPIKKYLREYFHPSPKVTEHKQEHQYTTIVADTIVSDTIAGSTTIVTNTKVSTDTTIVVDNGVVVSVSGNNTSISVNTVKTNINNTSNISKIQSSTNGYKNKHEHIKAELKSIKEKRKYNNR